MPRPRGLVLTATLALALAGCPAVAPTAPKPRATTGARATASPTPRPATPRPALQGTLVGRARLIAGPDGKLGAGATLISDAGGGVISDHGGGIISNNSGGVISDHGGGYRVQQAAGLAAYALAEAVVALTDAKGEALKDAAGRAIEAKTDGQGEFAFTQAIPQGASVARIKLFNGGELRALVVNDGTELAVDLDTASTLGATYVLEQFVKGDGAVLAKLPRTEAERLHTELGAIEGFLGSAPGYQAADMVAATDKLRAKVKAVDTVIEDVRALLLGQKQLGTGLLATEVPIAYLSGMSVRPDGTLLFAEKWPGRLRTVGADGTMGTLMDATTGRVKSTIIRIADVAEAPDGTLWVASETLGLFRIKPGATGTELVAEADVYKPAAIAVGPDGTLYTGEYVDRIDQVPRLMARRPDGTTQAIAVASDWQGGKVAGLHCSADGTLTVLYESPAANHALYRVAPSGAVTTLAAPRTEGGVVMDMAVGPDGTIYLSQPSAGRVAACEADGTLRPVAGKGGPAATAGLAMPGTIAVAADGTLYVNDIDDALLWSLEDGTWTHVAGSEALIEEGETTSFAINQPTGVAFDPNGDLLIVEAGVSRVRRFKGGKLEAYAGSTFGHGGDGGPATQALMTGATNVARVGGDVYITEVVGGWVRRVKPDGTIDAVIGGGTEVRPRVGESVPAAGKTLPQLQGLAVAPDGTIYTSTNLTNQIYRWLPGPGGGTYQGVAGLERPDDAMVFDLSAYMARTEADPGAVLGYPMGLAWGPDGALYFAEMLGCRVGRIVGLEAGGTPRIERVAGRPFAEMIAKNGQPDGTKATECSLAMPTAVAFDGAGNLYFAEAGIKHIGAFTQSAGSVNPQLLTTMGMPDVGGRVRKVAPDGTITTVAGPGSPYFAGEGDDSLLLPTSLAVSAEGRIAIGDLGANAVRIIPAGRK